MDWIIYLVLCCGILCHHVLQATNQQTCDIQMSYTSPFVEAFYSDASVISGCTAQTDGAAREIHVISVRSPADELRHTDHVITLNIGPRSAYGTRMRATLIVLNSLAPIRWKLVTENLGPLPFQFVISANSTLIKPTNMVVPMVMMEDMPSDDETLLQWVTVTYSKVWSFSSIQSANVIDLQIGGDPEAPEECVIAPNYKQPHITASQVEPQRVGFCTFNPQRATLEVHIIWLLSARPNNAGRRSDVTVHLRESSRRAAARRSVRIILQADAPVTWNVMSDVEIGHLDIMSSHEVNIDGLPFQRVSVIQESVPTRGDTLLSWAQETYGVVVSFTEAVLANRFDITIGKANISRQPYLLSPDRTSSTSIEGSSGSDIGGPAGPNVLVECLKGGIRALVPASMVELLNLSAEDVTLLDRSCTSVVYMTLGLMLETQLDACDTTVEKGASTMIYRNRVLFFNGPEGSGAELGSGSAPSDDEDSVEPFYTSAIECELPFGRENNLDTTENHVTLHMDMYETPMFATKVVDFPVPLQDHSRLYFQVGVSGGQLRHDVVINQCWIQVADVMVHSIIDFSCPVDETVIFHELNPNYVSLNPEQDGNLKRFSFEVHWTRETFGLHTFVSCKLSLCSKDFNEADEEKGIPVCSTLEALKQACSGDIGVRVGQQLTTGPSKTLEIGPLLDSTKENPPANGNEIDNEVDVGNAACLGGASAQTVSGLGAGSAAAIAFAAFTMGVLLTACLWFIHAHTGPKREIPGSPRTLSTPSSPMVNGHIPNGHLLNGGPPQARHRQPPAHAANGPLHLANGGMNPNQIPVRGLMNGPGPIGESV